MSVSLCDRVRRRLHRADLARRSGDGSLPKALLINASLLTLLAVQPYRFVRHALFFAVMTTASIVVAIQFEERDLLHEHGLPYEEYAACHAVASWDPAG